MAEEQVKEQAAPDSAVATGAGDLQEPTSGAHAAEARAGGRVRHPQRDVKARQNDHEAKAAAGVKGRRSKRRGRHKWAMSSDERKAARRGKVLRVVGVVVALGVTLALALVVGTTDYRPSPVGWIPFIAVVTAIVLAFVYLQVLKRSLRLLERSNAKDCRRAERVRFRVRFHNTSPLFFFRIEAHFFTADLYGNPVSHAVTTMTLGPFEKYDMPFATTFDHIGTYQAGLDRVVVYDFLRLFSATLPGPRRTRIQVVPRLVGVGGIEFSNEAVVETTKAARSAISDSMDYAAVRDYVWGDPMKTVHWKISARTPGLMTKLFETYNNPGVAIILDFYGPGRGALELMRMFDCVVETGFSVARYAQGRGMDAEICYCDKSGRSVRRTTWRESDLPQIVEEMPRFSSEPARAADAVGVLNDQIRSIHGQSNLVVCTANLTPKMIETVVLAKVHRREPMVFAAIPNGLEGRERDQWLAPLARLDAAGVPYLVLVDAADLLKAGE